MPFKTLYQIFDSKHTAPVFTNTDYKMAYVEWCACLRKGGDVYRLEQTVLPEEELTNSEKYLYLVYRLRKSWKRFVNCGHKEEDIKTCYELEKELDDWHTRISTLSQKNDSPLPIKDREAFDFYLTVAEWREKRLGRRKYTAANGFDELVRKEVSRSCREFERKIDKYIKSKLNLL